MSVNFGQHPFKFSVEAMIQEEDERQDAAVQGCFVILCMFSGHSRIITTNAVCLKGSSSAFLRATSQIRHP